VASPTTRSPVRWRVFDPREHHRPDQLADYKEHHVYIQSDCHSEFVR
jgi:hypothetical protein